MVDVGGYYHFKRHEGEQLLFGYGHSVGGQTENYGYLEMYWTWGKQKDDKTELHTPGVFPGALNREF